MSFLVFTIWTRIRFPPAPPFSTLLHIFIIKYMKAGNKEYYAQYYKNNKSAHSKRMKDRNEKDNGEYRKKYDKEYHTKKYSKLKSDPNINDIWNEQKKKTNLKRKNIVVDFKKSSSCSKCKDSRWYLLDLHHLDPLKKDFNLGDATKYSIKKIQSEISKCICLCRNCHSEFHYLEKENHITIEEYLKN